uniref:PX domain-containing protein kinase-like protein isoform X3 n=1 Tax=Petromyzon marinus TaxID=7757 RepID=A0AAJ7TZ70_PETMA|nr:PX domain-containing protein kinase-like protein isoform X3 [Petromyzon marinus]
MSLLEKRAPSKVLVDDTAPLACFIEAAHNVHTHTEYIVRVQRGPNPENSWQVKKRYSDFDALNTSLQVSGVPLALPPKRLLGKLEREFVAERQRGLQLYLDALTAHPVLATCTAVRLFLDPDSYPANYTELALQQVSMFFRSEPRWEVVEPLRDMGWRIRKRYFLIKPKEEPKTRQLLSWADFGPDQFLSTKDLQAAMKLLPNISHPYVAPAAFAEASESSGLVVRTINDKGTLRDLIHKTKPRDHFLYKYCSPRRSAPLDIAHVRLYGRQILEALRFLQERGFPYGHVHAGNVSVEGEACRLLDLENALLGLPSAMRGITAQYRKINTLDAVDVFSFGLLLHEMAYGAPPSAIPIDAPSLGPSSSPYIATVLESILSADALRSGLPTLQQLLATPLFRDVTLPNGGEKPQFKIPSRLREALKVAREAVENRLHEDQRTLHQFRKLSRAQSYHGSEEEKKKRKMLARKRAKKSRQLTTDETEEPPTNGTSTGSCTSSPPTTPSTPTPTGIGAPPAPPPPPPPPPPPGPAPPAPPALSGLPAPSLSPPGAGRDVGRGALLGSIRSFSKAGLKSVSISDRNSAKV